MTVQRMTELLRKLGSNKTTCQWEISLILYPGGELSAMKVGTIHPFDFADSVLAVGEPSLVDTAVVVLDLSEPTLAYLEVADRAHQIYLSPATT